MMNSKWLGYIGLCSVAVMVTLVWWNDPEQREEKPISLVLNESLHDDADKVLLANQPKGKELGSHLTEFRMTTFTTELLLSKQTELQREKIHASEVLISRDYQYFIDELYSDQAIRNYYINLVPSYVLNAMFSLRATLIAEGREQYQYIMPHTAAFQLLADRLISLYQQTYLHGQQSDSSQLLLQTMRELEREYGDEFSRIIYWFGIDKLPEYSDILTATPSDTVSSFDEVPATHRLITELFPEFKLEPERVNSIRSYALDEGVFD